MLEIIVIRRVSFRTFLKYTSMFFLSLHMIFQYVRCLRRCPYDKKTRSIMIKTEIAVCRLCAVQTFGRMYMFGGWGRIAYHFENGKTENPKNPKPRIVLRLGENRLRGPEECAECAAPLFIRDKMKNHCIYASPTDVSLIHANGFDLRCRLN